MTISFGDLVSSLSTLGIDSPRLEARMMLAGVLNVDVNVIGSDISVDGEQEAEVKDTTSPEPNVTSLEDEKKNLANEVAFNGLSFRLNENHK